ncbi:SPT2 chromatin protein-domain-containing protein [Abortiporus biennis]|nr:SPT2 chromatin protein-domain-containing protein [Abortiporus biennis]
MSSFSALMALSRTQTSESEAAVKAALAEKQRKDALKRKQQEEKDRKDKELEAKLRLKRFEEEKRQQEREKKLAEQRAAKERERERKEEEQRQLLRYGPSGSGKRSKSEYPSSRNLMRRHSDSDDEGGGMALTREEKRKARQERELRYGLSSSKRSGNSSGYHRAGRRLPGGAIDSTSGDRNSSGSYRSARERLMVEPPTLIKLNVNKRDTRTIDEISRDLERKKEGRVLTGDEAKSFGDWWGTSKGKSKDESRATSIFGSRESSLERDHLVESKSTETTSKSKSQSTTPPAQSGGSATPKTASTSYASKVANGASKPLNGSMKTSTKGTLERNNSMSKPSTSKAVGKSFASLGSMKSSATRPTSSAPISKKRTRSPSMSPSPPPAKRRPTGHGGPDISTEIWKLFGKDRSSYVARDVFSDDEDMEADAGAVMREEARSARLARKEDEIAMEEERRYEEEKRRRKKERQRA